MMMFDNWCWWLSMQEAVTESCRGATKVVSSAPAKSKLAREHQVQTGQRAVQRQGLKSWIYPSLTLVKNMRFNNLIYSWARGESGLQITPERHYFEPLHDTEQIPGKIHDIWFFKSLKMRLNLTYRVARQKVCNHHKASFATKGCTFAEVSFVALQ